MQIKPTTAAMRCRANVCVCVCGHRDPTSDYQGKSQTDTHIHIDTHSATQPDTANHTHS